MESSRPANTTASASAAGDNLSHAQTRQAGDLPSMAEGGMRRPGRPEACPAHVLAYGI